jgi:septal ring factor EnvC (AmiA/AmiB activator)
MRALAFIAIGAVVAAVALIGPPFVQLQKDLQAVRARNAELESVVTNLQKELDAAKQARTERDGAVEEANSEIEKRQSEIVRLTAEVERLSSELEKALDLAKQTDAPNQQGDPAAEPSDGWQPQ